MNSYQILYKEKIIWAVNLSGDNAVDQITSLTEQGYKIFSRIVQAVTESDAIRQFNTLHKPAKNSGDVTMRNILCYRTNKLQRLPFLAYTIASYIVTLVSVLLLTLVAHESDLDYSMVLLVPIFIGLIWFISGLSIARWKNCGHKTWHYIVLTLCCTVLDFYFLGAANTLLTLYMLFRPQSHKVA
ncbi:hypothetical protein [Vibrio ezurae]|uniref:DUF805 domain-containing protein n=1 Tax=Vibrio ezurae NBRC 102218 TaxID=1219080 RepID=U3B3C0_9VIBR|nr:hypothetical protein [Vibrio ezurae]GAD79962.1 hypothetical protein VEZ01S_21_00860 [Vibrio ezurae NBRC 102218]